MRWCIIANPDRDEFHYRIPERWLSEDTPKERKASDRLSTCLPLSFAALQDLAGLLLDKAKIGEFDCKNNPISIIVKKKSTIKPLVKMSNSEPTTTTKSILSVAPSAPKKQRATNRTAIITSTANWRNGDGK
jgi:hypothetical protein